MNVSADVPAMPLRRPGISLVPKSSDETLSTSFALEAAPVVFVATIPRI